jgi:hypothetical protein
MKEKEEQCSIPEPGSGFIKEDIIVLLFKTTDGGPTW